MLCVEDREASKVDPRVCLSPLARTLALPHGAYSLKSASLVVSTGELPWGWGLHETDFFREFVWPGTGPLVGHVISFLGQPEPFCGKFSMLQTQGTISRKVTTMMLVDSYCRALTGSGMKPPALPRAPCQAAHFLEEACAVYNPVPWGCSFVHH